MLIYPSTFSTKIFLVIFFKTKIILCIVLKLIMSNMLIKNDHILVIYPCNIYFVQIQHISGKGNQFRKMLPTFRRKSHIIEQIKTY